MFSLSFPFSSFWSVYCFLFQFMMFEMAEKNIAGIRWIIEKCGELQIQIEDLFNALLK